MVSQLSISLSLGGCFIRWRMTSQNASASSRESSSATAPASDLPRASFARCLSSMSVLRPFSSLERFSRFRSIGPRLSCKPKEMAAATDRAAKMAMIRRGRAKNRCSAGM